jgi:hypothetical protein
MFDAKSRSYVLVRGRKMDESDHKMPGSVAATERQLTK